MSWVSPSPALGCRVWTSQKIESTGSLWACPGLPCASVEDPRQVGSTWGGSQLEINQLRALLLGLFMGVPLLFVNTTFRL